MKNSFTAFLFLSFAFVFGQDTIAPKENAKLVKENAVVSNEVKPEPNEGFEKFYMNLQNRIAVPESSASGTYRALVSFVVEKDGTLSDYKIVKETPHSIGLGVEVIRVLKVMPKWIPGSGRTPYLLPVTTVIENDPEPQPELKKD
jgi:hypothetical protein